ncbi:MAG: hypothetical protein KGI54_13550 [Pseudomonadota bacterium]|nr:hypothetical protein [Pseudomonadota bacterium]
MITNLFVVWPLDLEFAPDQNNATTVGGRWRTVVQKYFPSEQAASDYAVQLARENPLVPFAVLTVGPVFEVGQSPIIWKCLDDSGQLVIKGQIDPGNRPAAAQQDNDLVQLGARHADDIANLERLLDAAPPRAQPRVRIQGLAAGLQRPADAFFIQDDVEPEPNR